MAKISMQSRDYTMNIIVRGMYTVYSRAIAQLVERRTVVDKLADILSSCTRDSSVGRAEDCSG